MTIELYGAGASHARSLIEAGHYDATTAWSFSAEDGAALLGAAGSDWTRFASFQLGEDLAAGGKPQAQFKFPYGKGGKVYASALRSIRARASQAGATAVFDEAGRLLDQLNAKAGKASPRVVALPTARASGAYRMVRAAAGDAAEIYIYGPIGSGGWFDDGCVSANQFRQDLAALGAVKQIDVRVNSDGGDVFDGKAIYALLVAHTAKVIMHVDGVAASAASYICMAGDEIEIAEGAFMMIHNASGGCWGSAADMRQTADLLDAVDGAMADVYAARSQCPLDDVKAMMAATTWLDGKAAVEKGFADRVVENMKVAASIRRPHRFRNLPAALQPGRLAANVAIERMRARIHRAA